MPLILGKVVHWNLLFIVSKRQELKLPSWTRTSDQAKQGHFLDKLCNIQM